jgi:hypothetical protein
MGRQLTYLTKLSLELDTPAAMNAGESKRDGIKPQIKMYKLTAPGMYLVVPKKLNERPEDLYVRIRRAAARARENYEDMKSATFGYFENTDTGSATIWRLS